MRCLVTGGAGFIGDALVKRLVKEGYEVKALIHHTQPKYPEQKATYVNGDITDIDSLKPLVKDVDVVFHCAAFVKDYGSGKLFHKVNVEGTKNLVLTCNEVDLRKFIFLSPIRYESAKSKGYYTQTKAMTEQYLLDKCKNDNFPVVIIRPGNVYGPGATTWVLRPLKAIQKDRIALIDNGNGVFLHTYIDNLMDTLVASMQEPRAVGEKIDVTDGDNTITWRKYLNDLAEIAGKKPIKRRMSKNTALIVSYLMMILYKVFRIEPWVTPMAVHIFTNSTKVSIEKAEEILSYKPRIGYNEGVNRVKKWLQDENYI